MLRLGYGLIAAQTLPGDDPAQVYADALALTRLAEDEGFDSVWVTEHHFTDDGYLAALFPLLGAMAARTERVVLGTNVALAPLYNPLRLAEDAAAVANLSAGRLLLGLGIGYRDEEFALLGVPKSERVARITECVDVCRAAWGGEPFTFRGRDVMVRPAAAGPPEIWLGGWVDQSVRRAARLADGYISPIGDLADTERRVAMLPPETGIATTTFVVVSPDGTVPEPIRDSMLHVFRRYGEWYGSSTDDAGGAAIGRLVEMQMSLPDPLAGVLHGTPDEVAAALLPLAQKFAAERTHHLVVRMHHPGVPREVNVDQIRLFAREVLPRLR